MNITPDILEQQWSNITYTNGGFLQIDTDHPLEWYIGYQSISQRTLLLVSDTEIGDIKSSKSMIVSRRKRESDNRWTLSFELLRVEQQNVFAILCCDIIENSRLAENETDSLTWVIKRYKQWSLLLESQNSGLMDEHIRKGLLGELLFLEQKVTSMITPLAAVHGWSGADKADQDFMYPEGWFEIKSIGASATSVTISSLEQLSCEDVGELVIKRIDKVAPERSGAVSLNFVVRRVSSLLINDSEALDLFRTKLNAYGYIDLQEYSEQKYLCSGTQRFRVDENFPRLTSDNVPKHVASAQYELDLLTLENWQEE